MASYWTVHHYIVTRDTIMLFFRYVLRWEEKET